MHVDGDTAIVVTTDKSGVRMNIWRWLLALFCPKAGTNSPAYPESRRKALDEQAREAMRRADARLPPHSNLFP